MGLRINSNPAAIFGQRQANRASERLDTGLSQLASGLRIRQAADDAAGLAIAERFRASVRQLNQEVDSLQTGVNLTQTAEGGLAAQQDAVGRLRELATQAANGTLTDEQRGAINAEAQQLLEGIDDVAQSTEFNGQTVLDGSNGPITLDAEGDIEVDVNESTTASLGIDELDLSTEEGARAAIDALNTAGNRIDENRTRVGTQENRINSAIARRETQATNEASAESAIRDLDVARATIEQTRNQVLLQGGLSTVLQGNLQSETALRLLGG